MFDNFLFYVSTFSDIFICGAFIYICVLLMRMKRFQERMKRSEERMKRFLEDQERMKRFQEDERVTRICQWEQLQKHDEANTFATAVLSTRVDHVYVHLSKSRFQRVDESSLATGPTSGISGRQRVDRVPLPTSPPRSPSGRLRELKPTEPFDFN